MRWRILSCVLLFALAGVSCEMADDEPEAAPSVSAPALAPDEFTLTGAVIDAKEGAQPSGGIPGEDDVMMSTVGGIAIRPDEDAVVEAAGLEGCDTTQDAYVTYYTPETDAAGLEDDDAWPQTLEGRSVTVEGTRHEPDEADADASPAADDTDDADDCVLVVDTIRPATATVPAPADDDGPTTGQTTTDGDDGAGTESPEPTGEEGELIWPSPADFPEHEDTDPIFEGTPSPDPCEGAKACAEKREEEEAREESSRE
jgi:hypothetical protein